MFWICWITFLLDLTIFCYFIFGFLWVLFVLCRILIFRWVGNVFCFALIFENEIIGQIVQRKQAPEYNQNDYSYYNRDSNGCFNRFQCIRFDLTILTGEVEKTLTLGRIVHYRAMAFVGTVFVGAQVFPLFAVSTKESGSATAVVCVTNLVFFKYIGARGVVDARVWPRTRSQVEFARFSRKAYETFAVQMSTTVYGALALIWTVC